MEVKIALVNILHEYDIFPGENIEQEMKKNDSLTLAPEAVFIRIEKRSK